MLTGTIRSQIDALWNAFWTGGISNPLEVIEQNTYLLFFTRLDDLHTLEEKKANRTKKPMERRVFPEGDDAKGCPYSEMRWSSFKHLGSRQRLLALSSGSTRRTIYMRVVEQFRVLLPPIKFQREFARRVTAVAKLKIAHRASQVELDALFATLQHRAFRGGL